MLGEVQTSNPTQRIDWRKTASLFHCQQLFLHIFGVASFQERFREKVVLSNGSTSGHFVARKWKLELKMDRAIMDHALQFVVMIGTVLTTFLFDFYSEHISFCICFAL